MKMSIALHPSLAILAIAIMLTGCGAVKIENCSVVGFEREGVKFEADVKNRSEKAISELTIHVDTASFDSQTIGSATYIAGPILPKQSTHVVAIAKPHDSLVFSRDNRLLPIRSCFIQAIRYQDGTLKVLYNPV